MTLDVAQLLLLGIITASLHWIASRAQITKPLWSRAPAWLDALLRCAGCSGFWLGLGAGIVGVRPCSGPFSVFLSALLAVFVTPVFEAVLLWGLERAAVQEKD